MSQEGYDKLVAELRHMESVELPQIKEAIAEARAQGDLSENFEYHAAKREQGRLLSRIRFKQRVLENARVIDTKLLQKDGVQLLSKVEMTNLNTNARMTYTIASPHEANLREGKISIKSPIAEALLGKKVGDVVEVRDRPRSRDAATHALEAATPAQATTWISVDPKAFRGEILSVPTREEIAPVVDEQAIVELYSR